MSNVIAGVLLTKAVVGKACAVAMVVSAAGVAYLTVPDTDRDSLGSVSVEYAPGLFEEIAYAVDHTPGDILTPTRYVPQDQPAHAEPPVSGTNRDGWNGSENSPETHGASEGDPTVPAGSLPDATEPNVDKPVDTEPVDAEPVTKPADVDKTAPALEVLYPADGSHQDKKIVVFEGKTEPGAEVFAGRYPATVDAKGAWRIELVLSPGANGALFRATDKAGNTSYDKVTVWLDIADATPEVYPKDGEEEPKPEAPNPKETEDDKEVEVGFHAKQKYGTCDAENPYEVLWGTATPSTVVTVSSPYGSGIAEVGKLGHWEMKIYFPTAPKNTEFSIEVTAANGSARFGYIAKGATEEPIEEPTNPETPETTEPVGEETAVDR